MVNGHKISSKEMGCIEEQLKILVQNMHELKQRARPHIAVAFCEHDPTRQWSHNKRKDIKKDVKEDIY